MSGKLSPVGEEKQSTRTTSKRIKNKKQMESTLTDKSPSNLETSHKFRTKTKKPKFLSLKLELNTTGTTKSKNIGADTTPFKEKNIAENVGGEKEEELFATDSTISSIHDLLPSSTSAAVDGGRNLSSYGSSSSSSSLIRTALKKGASEEERWVSYSEVMSRRCCGGDGKEGRCSLALKLDYEQIMEAWLDKGALYIDGEPPQMVPDLHASADVFTGGREAWSLWTVPEMETTERLWREHREASLLRYKEKRQSRFFAKRIRYQVRKLNAEKRPRIKGRFVKRDVVIDH
ncbi:unnamed protein product [Eruca vesicaria subsp. sativa]|uniref:CCT domain-containing protein n=1 Tax=Eruca vesicaria subsp. sativa TaxID=29727 RepID=A0ABC8J7M7_ERUVS|nr:unnamed protein product [Eruca vesicaria subsp. sativa]